MLFSLLAFAFVGKEQQVIALMALHQHSGCLAQGTLLPADMLKCCSLNRKVPKNTCKSWVRCSHWGHAGKECDHKATERYSYPCPLGDISQTGDRHAQQYRRALSGCCKCNNTATL